MAFAKAGEASAPQTGQDECSRTFGVSPFITSSAGDDTSCVPSAVSMQAELSPVEGMCKRLPEGRPVLGWCVPTSQ